MNVALLDTDIFTEVFKRRNPVVAANAIAYLQEHGMLELSAMSRLEVLRGLREKGATVLLREFDRIIANSIVYPISDVVLDKASELWVLARQTGKPYRDADLIIAATALTHGRVLITGNTRHFEWIAGLQVMNWRESSQ